jgi:hypothetical protein
MSMLRYIELKSGHGDSGPAWIGRVKLSRSKTTVCFNGRALKKANGGGISGNYFDLESGEEFWISGIKKNGPCLSGYHTRLLDVVGRDFLA